MLRFEGYRGSSLLMVAAAAAGLAAVVPAFALGGHTLGVAPLPASDTGLRLLQQRGLDTLTGIMLMLAIATATVCTITLIAMSVSRAAARRPEFAVRRAVGATRRQLVSGGLVEGGVVALPAAAVGLTASLIVMRVALAAWPGPIGTPALRSAALAGLGITVVLMLGVMLPTFTAGRMYAAVAPSRIPPGLMVAGLQLGISFAVLLAAGQIGRHAALLVGEGRGEVHGNGQILQIDTSAGPAERSRRLAALIRASGLADLLEVTSVSSPGALEGLGSVDIAITDCGRCYLGGIATPQRAVSVALSFVSPDTFRALSAPLIEGRLIADTDDWKAPRVALVNRALANAHFQDGHAVGRHMQIGQGSNTWFEVVGVVEDRTPLALGGALQPPYTVYASVLQFPPTTVDLLVRPRAGHPLPEASLRAALTSVGTVGHVTAEATWWVQQASPLRWFANALWIGGAMVLILAILGTGAVMYQWVAALMPELAVRRAVGARRRDVLIQVLSRAVVVAIAGAVLGLVLSDLTSAPLAALAAGAPSIDVAAASRIALMLIAAALVAAFLPAWRAARTDPATLAATLAA